MPSFITDKTAPGLSGYADPLRAVAVKLGGQCQTIEDWFAGQWRMSPAPFYGSVDLRNAGYKLAPVDMNLFPAGFNNLNPAFFSMAVEAAAKAVRQAVPAAKSILIVPENHTRNLFYWDNIRTLKKILESAGFSVGIGSLLPPSELPSVITLADGTGLPVSSLTRTGDVLTAGGMTPDVIVLNNDLSEGVPAILQSPAQPVLPPPELGWGYRLKSEYFQYYAAVSEEFAALTGIDPWQIAPLFRHCGEVDFMRREGQACLVHNATELFEAIRHEFGARGIAADPFIVVKADAGTYGMGVMTIRHVDELTTLNRKQRTGMAKTKSGQPVSRVILQEGVYSYEVIDEAVAEPVVYLFGERVVGGFYRIHQGRGPDENLNAPGMAFEPLPFIQPCDAADSAESHGNIFYLYGLIARLSMLAAAREMKG